MRTLKLRLDVFGAVIGKSGFQVEVPGVSRMGIWPAHVGFDARKRGAWLNTLELHQLRALQDRIKSYLAAADRKAGSEGRTPNLGDAVKAMGVDQDLIVDAVGRWLERNP